MKPRLLKFLRCQSTYEPDLCTDQEVRHVMGGALHIIATPLSVCEYSIVRLWIETIDNDRDGVGGSAGKRESSVSTTAIEVRLRSTSV